MDVSTERLRLERAVGAVEATTTLKPRIGLVLGSGLGAFAGELDERQALPYEQIEGMPVSIVEGHAGNLVLGRCDGAPVVAMQGRVHLYEGHAPNDVVFGARLMRFLGAETIIITNAAGGIGEGFRPGDLMLIEDHLNLTGHNCLVGPNDPFLGPRFVDMTTPYDIALREMTKEAASELRLTLHTGVYAGLLGPTYETPAEVRMLRSLGADAVGMSTVLEVIAARHVGARVLGISCITNLAAGLAKGELSHEEVKETAARVRDSFVNLLRAVIGRLA